MPQGRKSRNIELLETLVEWSGGQAAFAKTTDIWPQDVTNYLKGKPVALKRLRRAAQDLFTPVVTSLAERSLLPDSLPERLLGISGLYGLFDSGGRILYFGKAKDLHLELNRTLNRLAPKVWIGGKFQRLTFRALTKYYSAYGIEKGDADLRHTLEALVLRVVINDTHNQRTGKFKSPG